METDATSLSPHPPYTSESHTDVNPLTRCAKSIAASKLPHASKQLAKTTVEDGHPDDCIGHNDIVRTDIEEGENEGRGREGVKTKRAWVGDLAPRRVCLSRHGVGVDHALLVVFVHRIGR